MSTIAIIGLGSWGMRVLRNFYSLETVSEIIVFDLDVQKIKGAKNSFPKIKVAASVESILHSGVRGVVVVTDPLSTHYQLGKLVLNSGKHLWLEKPLAASLREARDLVALASEKKLQLHVDNTFVYSVPARFIKETLIRGELGEVRSISMVRCNIEQPGVRRDVFWDLAYHDLSMLSLWFSALPDLTGVEKDSVSDNAVSHGRIFLKYASGPDVTIEAGRTSAEKIRKITITGSDAALVYEDLDAVEPVKIYRADGQLITVPKLHAREPLLTQAEQFIACIEANIQSETNGIIDLEIIELLERISEPC